MAFIVGKYKIQRMDRYNLRAYELRMTEPRGKYKDLEPEKKWVPMDAYFASFANALSWLYDKLLADGDSENAATAKTLLREYYAVRDEILDAAGDAVGIAS